MLGFQLHPGIYQVPRQTLRHWPLLTAAVTACALTAAVPAFAQGHPAQHLQAHIASAADQLSAMIPAAPASASVTIPASAPAMRPGDLKRVLAGHAQPAHYRVRKGDTLSVIARRVYGHADRWPALWWANRHKIHNPAALPTGLSLELPPSRPVKAWMLHEALAAIPHPVITHPATQPAGVPVSAPAPPAPVHAGIYSFAQLEALWTAAGGPAGAASQMAAIAICESGGNPGATNASSGAAGLWQINGLPFPGNPYDPMTNARMAVAKYNAAGGTSPWVCQA